MAACSITGVMGARGGSRAAQRHEVDLSLALAVDASGSVNDERFDLQKRGYIEAFARPELLRTITAGPHAAISVAMFQWTGVHAQSLVVPWMRIDSRASLSELAMCVTRSKRELLADGTSISGAIEYGVSLLAQCPFTATRHVIDISGDGSNNTGRPPDEARNRAVEHGININGLPILAVESDLDEYYRRNVICGPGAFVLAARTFDDFGQAILRKMMMEIATPRIGTSRSVI